MIGFIRAVRRRMYKQARILGDVQAVLQGRIGQRIAQRQAGALARKYINRLVK
jgi:hypothetical protein